MVSACFFYFLICSSGCFTVLAVHSLRKYDASIRTGIMLPNKHFSTYFTPIRMMSFLSIYPFGPKSIILEINVRMILVLYTTQHCGALATLWQDCKRMRAVQIPQIFFFKIKAEAEIFRKARKALQGETSGSTDSWDFNVKVSRFCEENLVTSEISKFSFENYHTNICQE